MKTICSWCGKIIIDGESVDGLVSHGMCGPCYAYMTTDLEAELLEARLADQQEERWAREALPRAPRSVLETLAEGSLLDVARKVARELLEADR